MKKLTTIWTIIGIVVTLAAVCAAVFFYLRKRSEKIADEEINDVEAPAETPDVETAAQSA